MKKILVPTDFSKAAQCAAEVAADIAKRTKAQIVLLHIVEQPTKESFNVEGQVNIEESWEDKIFTFKLLERNKQQLLEQAKKMEAMGVVVKQELRMGNPFHGMNAMITEHVVDLIVMGTSSRSKLDEIILGSNTEKVVRYAKCPVLTVHDKSLAKEFKNIAYATSLNENEKTFSDSIKKVQELYNSTIHLVRVNTPLNFKPDTEVKRTMESFAKRMQLKNYTLNIFNDLSEEDGILHFANSINADLICMTTHGRTGLVHLLAGSIAEDVVNNSIRPVLTFVTKD